MKNKIKEHEVGDEDDKDIRVVFSKTKIKLKVPTHLLILILEIKRLTNVLSKHRVLICFLEDSVTYATFITILLLLYWIKYSDNQKYHHYVARFYSEIRKLHVTIIYKSSRGEMNNEIIKAF